MQKLKLITLFILAFFPLVSFGVTIGDVAENLMGPTSILTKLMMATCYIVGVALIFMGLAQYKVHRQSPKLVPLTTPITLLILGVVALLIPYTTGMFETGKTEETASEGRSALPLPDMTKDKPGFALPAPKQEPERTTQPKKSKQTQEPGDGGHWTSDPRYR